MRMGPSLTCLPSGEQRKGGQEQQHKGPSWQETNVPKGQPAANTGHVWGSLQVIQLLGFKLPWHQWEQMGAVQLYHEQITDSWVKQFWCYFKPLSPLVTGISPLQHHFHTILASPHLNLMFLSDHDGKLSSTRSNRAYLQCFPQSHTKRSKTQSLWWSKENHRNEDILWSIILRPRSNSDVTLSEKPAVITATTEETLRVKRSDGSSSCSDLISLPGEMVLFLLLAALSLFPTGEAGEWWSHPQRPRPTPHGTDLLRCYTHAHSGPGSCKEISELRSNFLKDHQHWSHLPSPAFASVSTAGSLLSFFQGKSSGAWGQATLPFPIWHLLNIWFQRTFSAVGFPRVWGLFADSSSLLGKVRSSARAPTLCWPLAGDIGSSSKCRWALGREGEVNVSGTLKEATDHTWNGKKQFVPWTLGYKCEKFTFPSVTVKMLHDWTPSWTPGSPPWLCC